MSLTLGELAKAINAELEGQPDTEITGVGSLRTAQPGQLSFLANRRYLRFLSTTNASAVVLSPADREACPVDRLVAENPYTAYVRALRLLFPEPDIHAGQHESAAISSTCDIHPTCYIGANSVIGDNVLIGERSYIGPGCVIGDETVIGNDCYLVANVTVCHDVKIGDRVRLHPGVVIGADGFGIANDNGRWLKIPQLGSVVIEDEVEIGANSTVDRGALEDTVIGRGVNIDNQVQIGHNVTIGDSTAIAGCAGIAGSTHVGKRCLIGGACSIAGHLEITDDVIITGMSGVANSIREAGTYSSGIPVTDNRTWLRNITRFKHLDELARRIKVLEENHSRTPGKASKTGKKTKTTQKARR